MMAAWMGCLDGWMHGYKYKHRYEKKNQYKLMEQTNTNINNKQNGMCDKSLENTLKKQNHCHGKINSFWL